MFEISKEVLMPYLRKLVTEIETNYLHIKIKCLARKALCLIKIISAGPHIVQGKRYKGKRPHLDYLKDTDLLRKYASPT